MKIAHVDEKKQLLGWYDQDIHGQIPKPNIVVEEFVWQNAIDHNHNRVNSDGTTDIHDFRSENEKKGQLLQQQIIEAKRYLSSTDFKMTIDYFDTLTPDIKDDLLSKRGEAREFIRANDKS